MPNAPQYVLSVDVEDYFQVEAFAKQVSRTDWDNWPSRVVDNTHRTLDMCDEYGSKATFFVLGWVARKFPSLVAEIQSRGHELACHSFWHRPVYSLTPDVFREDLRQARDTIQQAGGAAVTGYRAPTWSITAKSTWALDVLAEEGFTYDSSIFPIRHDLYGMPGAERFPYRLQTQSGELLEFPPATVKVFNNVLPSAGGGYLRILPFPYTRWAIRQLAREDGRAVVIYFHPWEIDPSQPRIQSQAKSRFRHYTNLGSMEARLRRLMRTHTFRTFRDLIDSGSVFQ
jgi:polysaccharide deacetylase family protein (PEP-CTERM system associated)